MIELENENINLYQFDMNDAYSSVLIKEYIMYLQNIDKESDKESDNKESDNDDGSPHVTLLSDLTKVEPEVQDNGIWDLGLILSAVVNVIADSTLPTGAHILECQYIWTTNTGATSHVTKHT